MNRPALTTKQNKAKCLNYRSGKRCGRLGRYLVDGSRPDPHGTWRRSSYRYPVCQECKDTLVARDGAEIKGYSPKGYTVKSDYVFGHGTTREYVPIQSVCAKCEQSEPTSKADAYCTPCGVEVMDAENYYAALLAEERAYEVH